MIEKVIINIGDTIRCWVTQLLNLIFYNFNLKNWVNNISQIYDFVDFDGFDMKPLLTLFELLVLSRVVYPSEKGRFWCFVKCH